MIGKYTAKVDEKGRLFVPAKLRSELGETFFVTIGTNAGRRCLTVYPQAGWESLCARYDALPLSQKSGTTSFLFSNAVECCPDKQFRFLLSSNLYQYAGIDRDVVIVGRAGQAAAQSRASHLQIIALVNGVLPVQNGVNGPAECLAGICVQISAGALNQHPQKPVGALLLKPNVPNLQTHLLGYRSYQLFHHRSGGACAVIAFCHGTSSFLSRQTRKADLAAHFPFTLHLLNFT